jgi:hypothetical protein
MLHVYCLLEHFDKIEISLAYGFRLDLDLACINLGYNSIWAECRLWGAKVTDRLCHLCPHRRGKCDTMLPAKRIHFLNKMSYLEHQMKFVLIGKSLGYKEQ